MKKVLFESIIHSVIREYLNEAFKSNRLRNWFKQHGGVKKYHDHYNDTVTQDALGDVSDEDILFMKEYDNYIDAIDKKREMTKYCNGLRSEWDKKAYFTVYQSRDGYFLLVGLDRNAVPTGTTWGGETSKKLADRKWRDDREPHNKNHYVDDRDTYYFSRKARDFGLYRNRPKYGDYEGKMKDNKNIRRKMTDDQWKEYQDYRLKDMRDYLNKYYPKRR